MSQRAEELEFNLSNRQEHNLSNQLNQAYSKSNLCQIGESKLSAQNEARANGASNSHEVAKNVGIYSYATEDKFKNQCHKFGEFAFENGIKHISAIKDSDVKNFLTTIIDAGYAYNTVKQYCGTLEKMDTMLSQAYPQNRGNWSAAISECRDIAKIECERKDFNTRSYRDPASIINSLPEQYQLAASMQLNHGLRISDACYFSKIDNNHVSVNSKNGQIMTKELTPRQQELFDKFSNGGKYAVSRESYDYNLQKACVNTRQEWHGSHGLRHNYAQSRMSELTDDKNPNKVDYGTALLTVSKEMGHHRLEITEKYLR
jgi:integrase